MIYGDLTTYGVCFALMLIAAVLDLHTPRAHNYHLGFIQMLVVSLVMMVVSTLITAALTPKPKPPEPGKADKPEIQEGKTPLRIYGAVWVKDPFMASWKQLEPSEPIRPKKAGKK